ncbi:hypothetical protein BCD48_00040 [Pseudofrankia sp. BMG5.36]|nr:hypothetical protein BCD48_00040 [Pseudofrankia sp. BMG5.36]
MADGVEAPRQPVPVARHQRRQPRRQPRELRPLGRPEVNGPAAVALLPHRPASRRPTIATAATGRVTARATRRSRPAPPARTTSPLRPSTAARGRSRRSGRPVRLGGGGVDGTAGQRFDRLLGVRQRHGASGVHVS